VTHNYVRHGTTTLFAALHLATSTVIGRCQRRHRHQEYLAGRAPPRVQLHFTLTYPSWPNQVEIWFHIITQKAIRRGTFGSVKEVVAQIEHFVGAYNVQASPFVWTATADSILKKIGRLCEHISGTQHLGVSNLCGPM
jgi:putative transposase